MAHPQVHRLEGTLEKIASMRQVDRKSRSMVIQDLKERLLEGEFTLCQWILTGSMWAYALTKKIEMRNEMQELLAQGSLWMRNKGINRVWCVDGEIRVQNIQNCNRERRN